MPRVITPHPSLLARARFSRRYDGVWSRDVAKCGLYGAINEEGADPADLAAGGGGGAGGLPSLRLQEPMRVLEERAYELQVGARGPGRAVLVWLPRARGARARSATLCTARWRPCRVAGTAQCAPRLLTGARAGSHPLRLSESGTG